MKENKKIVCLGGGIGTSNLIRGLKEYTDQITVVLSMADDGGSAGRLRRLYNILPPGDLVSCMSAFSEDQNSQLSKLLTYRFPGERYGKDEDLSGHKLGNLIMVAMRDITGSFEKAIELYQQTFHIPGTFLPATLTDVSITGWTLDGKKIEGEETIDLGKYQGEKSYDRIELEPNDVAVNPKVMDALKFADVIIAGPGDLYTTVLPTIIVKDIKNFLCETKIPKIFITNITNQPEETNKYQVSNYVDAAKKHIGVFPFDKIIVNNNYSFPIPKDIQNTYVTIDENLPSELASKLVTADLVNESHPLYHDSGKLAKVVWETV